MSEERRILETAAFDRLRQWGGDDLLGRMLEIFFRDAPERLRTIEEAVKAREPAGVERSAHSLKSSCGNLGADALRELCFQVERAAERGDLDEVRELLPALRECHRETLEALRRAQTPETE